jgi:hypothetical protein
MAKYCGREPELAHRRTNYKLFCGAIRFCQDSDPTCELRCVGIAIRVSRRTAQEVLMAQGNWLQEEIIDGSKSKAARLNDA